MITTQSNSAANLISQRLISSKEVNPACLLRVVSFNYANRTQCPIPEDLKAYCKTFDDLLSDSQVPFIQRLEEVKRYRLVIGTSNTISQLLEAVSLRTYFTHAIIDEAGQCTEIDVLVPMTLVGVRGQTIMAGDPMQMPPLIINHHAKTRGLSNSMLGRLIECYSNFAKNVRHNFLLFHLEICSKLFGISLGFG